MDNKTSLMLLSSYDVALYVMFFLLGDFLLLMIKVYYVRLQ